MNATNDITPKQEDDNTTDKNEDTFKEDYNLEFTVTSYEITQIKNESIIQFTIVLHSCITKTSWTITRTNFVIDDYINSLFKEGLLIDKPLPKLRFVSDVYLATYTGLLNDYLHQICSKEHIINSFNTRHFFELEDNHIKSTANYHKNIATLTPLFQAQTKANSQIVEVLYSSYENFLFVGIAHEPPSLLSKIFFSSSPNDQYEGSIEIYNIVKGDNMFDIEKIDTIKLISKPNVIKYVKMDNNEFNLLFIGSNDGSIETYQVYNNFNLYLSKTLTEYLSHLSISSNPLINLGIDKNSGYVYSVSLNEKRITISEFNYQTIIAQIPIDYSVSLFTFDNDNHKIFIANTEGSLYIYQIENLINLTLLQAIYSDEVLGRKSPIERIWLESDRNFLFISKSNTAFFYDFTEKDNFQFEIYKRLTVKTFHKRNVTGIQYRNCKGELIIATSNGMVEFWSHDYQLPVYLYRAHNSAINQVIYEKNKGYLITIGSDGRIKLWTLPESWTSEEIRRDTAKNSFSIIEASTQNKDNMALLKDVFARMSFGSFRKFSDEEIIKYSNRKFSEKEIVTPMTANTDSNTNLVNNQYDLNESDNDEYNEGSDLDGWEVDI